MKLSAVIVTHNSADVLESCWRSVRLHLPAAEIIVVDNASADDTNRLCRGLDGATLITNEINIGYGRACNKGAESASGSHALFVNPDVRLSEVDVRPLEAESHRLPFGLVAPVVDRGTRGGSLRQHWARDMVRHAVGPLRPSEVPVLPKLALQRRTWWPSGALLLVDREEFASVGGFDRRFFLYYEDQDLARRYLAAGLPVRLTRSVRAEHRGGGSSSGDGSSAAVRQGWSYLSWIEYLWTWNGQDTAVRAARSAERLRSYADRALVLMERTGVLSARASRKRVELAELNRFVQWQSSFGEGTAADDFCPRARQILAGLRAPSATAEGQPVSSATR